MSPEKPLILYNRRKNCAYKHRDDLFFSSSHSSSLKSSSTCGGDGDMPKDALAHSTAPAGQKTGGEARGERWDHWNTPGCQRTFLGAQEHQGGGRGAGAAPQHSCSKDWSKPKIKPCQLWDTAQTPVPKVTSATHGRLCHQPQNITQICTHQGAASAQQPRGVHGNPEPGLLLLRKVETNVIIQVNHLMRWNKASDEGSQLNTFNYFN